MPPSPVPKEHGSIGTRCIHDGADVVHACLKRRRFGDPIGHASTAFVEAKEAADGGETTVELRTAVDFPGEFDVMESAGDVHEVRRPVSQHLVGDAQIAAAARSGSRATPPRQS